MAFSKQLDQVKDQFRDLSSTLEEVCENLKEPGSPPPSEILDEINSAIKSFEELKSSVTKWAESVQMPDTEAQELDSIKTITTLSENIMARQNRVQDEKVLEYINRARSIIYAKEGESFPPLEDFHKNLDKLEKRVSTSPISDEGQNERTQILKNRHPINGVLTLLEHGDELDQKNYDQISEIISEQYGHSFMIATVRRSLILPEIPDPKGPQPSDAEEDLEKPEQESANDLQTGEQAEIVKKIISEDVTDKDGITESKKEDEDISTKPVFCFNASETAHSIASSLLKSADCKFERGFPDLFWALIREKRFRLAYWLTYYAEKKALDMPLSSFFVEALIHGLAVQNATGSSVQRLTNIYSQKEFELELQEADDDAGIRLLMVSGVLRPSLFAPHTVAQTDVLKSSASLTDLNAFFAIVQAVEEFAQKLSPISTDSLTATQKDQQWKEQLDSLITDAENWLNEDKDMRNPILAQIWQGYLNEGELVHSLVSPIANNNEQQIEKVSKMIMDYNSDAEIRTRAQEDADQAANKAFNDDKFRYSTTLLETGIREAINFASCWVKLHNRRPSQISSYHRDSITTLQDKIQKHADTARNELNVFAEQHKDCKPILAGVDIAQHGLDAITGLFYGEISSTEDDKRVLLSAELLKIPNLELTEEWTPTEEALDNLGYYLVQHIALPDSDRTWEKALENQTANRNHWATEHILGMIAITEDDEIISKLKEERQKKISECITDLETNIERTEKKIVSSLNILTDQERSEFVLEIKGIDPKKVLNFMPANGRLSAIRKRIKEINDNRLDECRKQLETLTISEDDKRKIEAVLERNDVRTAEEFIAVLEKGEQLLDLGQNWVDRFKDFFPKAVNQYQKLLQTNPPQKIISNINNGSDKIKRRYCHN